MKRFQVLDVFRGLCALCVVGYHTHWIGSVTEWTIFRESYLFVEFFFVLSGFIFAHTYAHRPLVPLRKYFCARVVRLFPLHVLVLLLFVGLEFIKYAAINYGVEFTTVPFSGRSRLELFIPNLLLLHAWLPNISGSSFNYPSWSISVEFYIYIVFYFSLFLKGKLRNIVWLFFVGGALYILINELPFSLVSRGLFGFFLGVIGYGLYVKYMSRISVSINCATTYELSTLLLIALGLIADFSNKKPIMCVAFLLAIFVFSLEQGQVSNFLKRQQFIWLGKLSYALYITHAFILCIIQLLLKAMDKYFHIQTSSMYNGERFNDLGGVGLNNLAVLTIITTCVIASWVAYQYVERPLQKRYKRWEKESGSVENDYESSNANLAETIPIVK